MMLITCPDCSHQCPSEEAFIADFGFTIFKCPACCHEFKDDECDWYDTEWKPMYAVMVGNVSGIAGPSPDLQEMLGCSGWQASRIVRFNRNDTNTTLYRWHKNEWRGTTNE